MVVGEHEEYADSSYPDECRSAADKPVPLLWGISQLPVPVCFVDTKWMILNPQAQIVRNWTPIAENLLDSCKISRWVKNMGAYTENTATR